MPRIPATARRTLLDLIWRGQILAVGVLLLACAPPSERAAEAPKAEAPKAVAPQVARELPTVRMPYSVAEPDIGKSSESGGIDLAYNAFEGLVNRARDGFTIVPGVAERWETAADGVTWTFHLRKEAKFSDGTPVTARTFVDSWRRVADPTTASKYAGAMYVVKGFQEANQGKAPLDSIAVKALDDYTFQTVTAQPAPYFLTLLATTWVSYAQPMHVINKVGDKWVEAEHIVSNGPFKVTSHKRDQEMVLEPNPHYWGEKPRTRVVWKILADRKYSIPQAMAAYEAEELDVAFVPFTDLDRVQKDPRLSKELASYPNSYVYWINIDTTNPPFNDRRVRRALYCGIDREKLARDVLKGAFRPWYTVLSEDVKIGYNPDARIKCSVEDAKKWLAEAGYPNGQGLREFELVGEADPVDRKAAYQAIQAMWRENLGIKIRFNLLQTKARQDWRVASRKTPYDLFDGGWLPDYNDPYNWHNFLFSQKTDRNWPKYNNKEFEDLVTRGAQELDEKKRHELHQKAEEILVQDAAVIPYVNVLDFQVRKPWVKSLIVTPEMRNYRMVWMTAER